ncbi:MAG TPA: ABC transporter substrate-binding protein [Stellaceae bacterium]|nr:ABC transporter substrate-binding protein [Stellaceae bacterium]
MPLIRTTLVALMALAFLAHGAAAEPLKIRVAWITVPTSLAPILFAKPELARHLGTSYTVEPTRFAGSSQMTTALASGDLDVAELSYSSFAFAVENGHMNDLRVIADEIEDGVPGYFSSEYRVLNDGPVKSVDDLKGKVLATNVIGTGTDIGMRAMMRKHGLEDKRDYTIIEANFANMAALLFDHKADLITSIPFFQTEELRQKSHPLFELRDVMGVSQILSLSARAPFIEKNRAALTDYMEDYLRSLRWYLNPANHKEAVAIVSNFTKLDPSRFDRWVLTKGDQYRDPDGKPNLAAMQHNIDEQRALGFLAEPFAVAQYADLSIVEAADRRLQAEATRN